MKRTTITSPLKAVAYTRQGKEHDAKPTEDLIASVLQSEGWTLTAEFCDHAVVSKVRPGLDKAKNLLESGTADVLLIPRLEDSLATTSRLAVLFSEAIHHGYAIYSSHPFIDTTTDKGAYAASVLIEVAALDRAARSEAALVSIEERRSGGRQIGRPGVATPEMIKQLRFYLTAASRGEIMPSYAKIAAEVGLNKQTCVDYCKRILAQESRTGIIENARARGNA